MNKFILRQSLLLFLTAVIWGVAFVAQSEGMEYVGPFTYNSVRCILGGLVLLPCILLYDAVPSEKSNREKRSLWTGGICCGIILFAASNFQQFGIQYTSVGKAGFITAMYIVLVPLLGLFVHKKVGLKVWIGVGFAVCGLYLLCMNIDLHQVMEDIVQYGTDYVLQRGAEYGLEFSRGDILVLICAFIFALHILVIDHFTTRADGVRMSCIQFWVCGILSLLCSLMFESPSLNNIWMARLQICYGGIMSCGVAYTLQIIGQKDMNPTVASLILSLESVVSVVAAFLILHQTMSRRELMGCCLMVVAIVLAQLPNRSDKCMINREK
ncbi:MAG: DMT family transporter [Lachnospiraceae bacterium]|nr:DMT family transporter [Lachnospiraceae bacterium]